MPTFDIVSKVDLQEVENAINQATKEIIGRYDFKGSKAKIEWDKKAIVLYAESDDKLETVMEILQQKLIRRGIDLMGLKIEKTEASAGSMRKQVLSLVQGIDKEVAKKVTKAIKDSGIKVQAQIMGEVVRVSSKSIDALQETIQYMKNQKLDVPLQFENMRS
jgi:cyclic-di-GMP-binding protein